MKRSMIPRGYSIGELSVTLIDDEELGALSLATDTEGDGAYLRLKVSPGDAAGVPLLVEDLDALAALGRWLVAMHDSMNSEGADAGMGPAAAVTQRTE